MNVDEALRRLGADSGFPREAMEWALAHWDEAQPRFLSRLRGWAARGAVPPEAANEAFFLVHLCGDKGDTGVYEPLCRLVGTDPGVEEWLSDAISESLPGILIKTFDGDVTPLMKVIEDNRADEFVRTAALAALGYLVRTCDALDDETMVALLRRLHRDAKPDDGLIFWMAWADVAAGLGHESLRSDLVRLNDEGRLEKREYGLADFDSALRQARENPSDLSVFEKINALPFENAVATLESWSWENPDTNREFDEEAFAQADGPFDEPYVNPLRDVGRNDPCPCGSGKKFKKCCLPA